MRTEELLQNNAEQVLNLLVQYSQSSGMNHVPWGIVIANLATQKLLPRTHNYWTALLRGFAKSPSMMWSTHHS